MTATTAPSEPKNGAELLARIRPVLREESTSICLRPDLLDAWEEASTKLNESTVADSTGRLAGGHSAGSKKLAQQVADLEKEMDETAVEFKFRAMPKDEWRTLCDKHPPRKGNDMDFYAGFDRDAVEDAAVRVCLIDPVFDDASWVEFIGVCNPSEWQELRSMVRSVNRSVVEVPKSELASRILAKRGTTSKSRAPGA